MDTKAFKILVFAGTFEGHCLSRTFYERGWQDRADFCVATEYGTEVLEDISGLSVIEGRLDQHDMIKLLSTGVYGMVIDATHPYAQLVTENIRAASEKCGIPYVRLLREEGKMPPDGVVAVSSISEAVELLNRNDEKILLTTGAKELSAYAELKDIEKRVVARVLPTISSIESCLSAGIASKHIVAMQGPFTKEMNLAMMEQYGCKWLVTKNTGKPGGFDDKLACLSAGYHMIVIGRPLAEEGFGMEKVIEKAEAFYGA